MTGRFPLSTERIFPEGRIEKYCPVCNEIICKCPSFPSSNEIRTFPTRILLIIRNQIKLEVARRRKNEI